MWTMVFFLMSLGVTIWITPMLASSGGLAFFWGVLLRIAVFLYVFAFLDAYFTAREMTAGTDAFISENPRVAAILNLLTRGFGYFYLGQRTAGFAVFIGLGFLQQIILTGMKGVGKGEEGGGALVMELLLAGLAIHAYQIGRKSEEEILATIQPAPQSTSIGGLPPAVPIGLAILFGAGYLGLCCLGFFMPDYSAINQTAARISQGDQEVVYTNPDYGILVRAPGSWSLADQDTGHVVSGRRLDQVCAADLRLAAWSPILPISAYEKALSANLERPENKGARIVENVPALLSGVSARNIVLTVERQGSQITENQILARKGMTLYVLTTDSLSESTANCESDFRFIREHIALPK
jgi:hypothetical protein